MSILKSIQRFLGRFLIGLFVCFLVFFVANIAGLTVYSIRRSRAGKQILLRGKRAAASQVN